MAKDIQRARIAGPQTITYKGIDLGHTLDGVDLEVEREFTEVNVDKYGKTPVDKVLTGNHMTLKFKLAQADWDQWKAAVPESSSYDGAGNKDRVDIGADAGYSLRQTAGLMVIHPIANAAGDLSDDVTIYLCASTGNIALPLKIDGQKTLEVTFEAFVSEAYGTGRRLGHIGPADVS